MAVYLSFHYDRDHSRVQQILNMGLIQGQKVLEAQDWEQVKRQGPDSIKSWIHAQMAYKAAVVVLVGAETANRPWVKYEIEYAWNNKKPLVGIRIHGLQDFNQRTDRRGPSPFARVSLRNGLTLDNYVPLHDPVGTSSREVYASISRNLQSWINSAARRS